MTLDTVRMIYLPPQFFSWNIKISLDRGGALHTLQRATFRKIIRVVYENRRWYVVNNFVVMVYVFFFFNIYK